MNILLLSLALFLTIMNHHALSQGLMTRFVVDSLTTITATAETNKFIWQGTNHGLHIINKRNNKERFLTKEHSKLPDNYVTSIVCLANGQTYIATKNGILLWDNYTFFVYNAENCDLPENYVTSMTLDKEENLLIRTPNCGLFKAIGHCIKLFKMNKVDP